MESGVVYVVTAFPCPDCAFSQTLGVFSTFEKAERFKHIQLTPERQQQTEIQRFVVDM